MHIAITGGIGTGKSYVCNMLRQMGVSVYDCDAAAKQLMRTSPQLRQQLISLIGRDVYDNNGEVQKRVVAQYLLASEANKQALNNVVHPAVAADYLHSGCEWLESAILFDSNFDKRLHFDFVVCVSAPRQVRIQRIVRRDSIAPEKAEQWIDAQMPQAEVEQRSHFVINNDGMADVAHQLQCLLNNISDKQR